MYVRSIIQHTFASCKLKVFVLLRSSIFTCDGPKRITRLKSIFSRIRGKNEEKTGNLIKS